MKKNFSLLILLAATLYAAAQAVSFTISIDLTSDQARGLKKAVKDFNTAQKAVDTNWVDLTPKAYLTLRVGDMLDSYNAAADETTLSELRDLYQAANAAKRQAAVDALR